MKTLHVFFFFAIFWFSILYILSLFSDLYGFCCNKTLLEGLIKSLLKIWKFRVVEEFRDNTVTQRETTEDIQSKESNNNNNKTARYHRLRDRSFCLVSLFNRFSFQMVFFFFFTFVHLGKAYIIINTKSIALMNW